MNGSVTVVTVENLLGEVARLKIEGYRLVTLSGVSTGPDQMEILYHFDKDMHLAHLRLTVSQAASVPSISSIFLGAFMSENEIQDLFNVRFHGLVIDYKGALFLPREVKTSPLGRFGLSQKAQPTRPDTHSETSRGVQ